MRSILFVVALLFVLVLPALAQTPVERDPRDSSNPISRPTPPPNTPAARPPSLSPADASIVAFVTILYLGVAGFVAMCASYVLMYLGKTTLRTALSGGQVPLSSDHRGIPIADHRRLLRPMLGLLTLIAAGLGLFFGGAPLAIAVGIGVASSGIVHDVVDGLRAKKGTR